MTKDSSNNNHNHNHNNSMSVSVFPRSLSTILVSVGGLATFLIIASLVLVSDPITFTVRGYFYGVVDKSDRIDFPLLSQFNRTVIDTRVNNTVNVNELDTTWHSAPQLDLPNKETSDGSSNKRDDAIPATSSLDNEAGGMNKQLDYTKSATSSSENEAAGTNKQLDDTKSANSSSEDEAAGTNKQLDDTKSATSSENEAGGTDKQLDDSKSATSSSENEAGGTDKQLHHNDTTPATSSKNEAGGMDKQLDNTTPATKSENATSPVKLSEHNSVGTNDTPQANLSSDSKVPTLSSIASNANKTGSGGRGCDLYKGSWFYDPAGPSYTNNSCPIITQMQNCQGNGRPDKEYESWRWKPSECELPRFDGKKFLELMRGKTLAFIGDSVARNQMESMLCLLWQVEAPKNRGNRKMQRWLFKSTKTMIVRIWSSWLVHKTSQPIDIAPENVVKLHLDAPDEDFMQYISEFDVIVLSSGHWFAKQSVYMLNNEIVGGQLWRPNKSKPMKVNNIEAFGISTETILTSMATHPNFTGLTIVRSFSPDHYEGGAWNTGGSCTGKVKPLLPGELVENGFTDAMHKQQVMGFEHASQKKTNKSKLKFMDITNVFGYRHDGHPGPYRSPDPNKITKRGPDGKPPPQDCLHWCMPGPVDTWNELVLEIIRREFEGNRNSSS